jgi:uroporphyrinogen decarboxylase
MSGFNQGSLAQHRDERGQSSARRVTAVPGAQVLKRHNGRKRLSGTRGGGMTPKERWLAVLNGEKPDRIPMDFWATPEIWQRLKQHFGTDDNLEVMARLKIDYLVPVAPYYVGPPLQPDTDFYGNRHRAIDYGTGVYDECVEHRLAEYNSIEEIEANYTWPTADWFDYSVLPDQVAGKEDYPIKGGGSEPFLEYAKLRGIEQAYIDLAMNPEMVNYCLDRLFDFAYEYTTRIYEALPGQVTLSYVAEDFGGQEHLLFAPRTIRETFIPRMKRMIDLAHDAGVYVFFHSDGAIRKIIPDMIAAGIDILNPLQWRCQGMERDGLKRDFGQQVVLHGGVDNQHTLAFGSVAEVQAEVQYNIEVLGANGGYILAPCHNIQPASPLENILALYETGYQLGRLS